MRKRKRKAPRKQRTNTSTATAASPRALIDARRGEAKSEEKSRAPLLLRGKKSPGRIPRSRQNPILAHAHPGAYCSRAFCLRGNNCQLLWLVVAAANRIFFKEASLISGGFLGFIRRGDALVFFGFAGLLGSIGMDMWWVGLASNSPPPQVRFFFIVSGV
ncbi:hypothetical protein ABZP36_035387 [Zizania latifolia]